MCLRGKFGAMIHISNKARSTKYPKIRNIWLVTDTSQTYLLFQTLLLLFCPHSCMIWTKLTRTNAVFSRAACMVLLCAGKWIFGRSKKFAEKYQKIHAPEGARSQKWDHRGVLEAPGAPLAR